VRHLIEADRLRTAADHLRIAQQRRHIMAAVIAAAEVAAVGLTMAEGAAVVAPTAEVVAVVGTRHPVVEAMVDTGEKG
jgi:hypothetical protein